MSSPRRAVRPRARSGLPTSPPARAPTRSTRSGKMYLAGPFNGAPLSLVAVTPALAGPYDYGVGRRPSRPPCRPADGAGERGLGHRPDRSSAASRSGCARSRSTSTSRTSRSTRPTARPSRSTRQGIGDQGTVTDFSSYFQVVNCRGAWLQAEDDDPPAGRTQADRAHREPATALRPLDAARRREHQIDRRDPAEGHSRSTSATSATSARELSWRRNDAPGARRSAR